MKKKKRITWEDIYYAFEEEPYRSSRNLADVAMELVKEDRKACSCRQKKSHSKNKGNNNGI